MPHDAAIMAGDQAVTLHQGKTAYPVLRHQHDDDIVAMRGPQLFQRAQFLRDIAALAAVLPAQRYMLNLCTDRYRFMVGFAAALCRGQVSLLPSSDAPGVLNAVAEDYPDLYALAPATHPLLPTLVYPDIASEIGAVPVMPLIDGDQPALILFTSGSTGRPKPVLKSWGALVRSARAAGARLGISEPDAAQISPATIIATVPHQHSYGLESTIMLALQHGLILHAGSLLYPGDIRAALADAAGPRILVTTPVHLGALVTEPDAMPPADLILSATAPLSRALAERAEACFAGRLIEIYGCTEAGQIATRRPTHDRDWHCLDGVELRQDDGGIWASGVCVEGTALLQDVIEPTGAGMFTLGGRSADLVDVAGKRTSLAHLDHQLRGIDGVTDGAFVLTEPDGSRVTRLAALAVAPGIRRETIMLALRARIDPAFLPRPLVLVDALPRNALGKLPREDVLRLIGRA
jgi:acyl-coenzyme A synthetase/AMP-(fatty) acid ligase